MYSNIAQRDSEKSKNYSVSDYVTLHYYNESYFNGPELSNLRFAQAPGSIKHMNVVFNNPMGYLAKNPSEVIKPLQTQEPDYFYYTTYPR